MPTIKQLIRNTRQPIRNVTKSPALRGALSVDLIVKDLLLDNSWVEPKRVNYTSSQ
ncbi:unnamed protein product [Withania somnifera]